jgi:hypothetical protein
VAGEGDEELRVERSVDEPQQVRLAGLHREHGRILGGAAVEVAGLAVHGFLFTYGGYSVLLTDDDELFLTDEAL